MNPIAAIVAPAASSRKRTVYLIMPDSVRRAFQRRVPLECDPFRQAATLSPSRSPDDKQFAA
jgi:hypothetical protein